MSAHLAHPGLERRTLCGEEPLAIVPCQECLDRRDALLRVHVESPRKLGKSFCGLLLGEFSIPGDSEGGDAAREVPGAAAGAETRSDSLAIRRPKSKKASGGRRSGSTGRRRDPIPLFRVSAEQARSLLSDPSSAIPICPGCAGNLQKFDRRAGFAPSGVVLEPAGDDADD